MTRQFPRAALTCCFFLLAVSNGQAQVGTEFTYQGRLDDAGIPGEAAYDFQFRLFDDEFAGNQIGSVMVVNDLLLTGGLFTVSLDYGPAAFTGDDRWLEILVRAGGSSGAYTVLSPRQKITAAPYAMHALSIPVQYQIPSGAVMYFNLLACPSGWTELVAARGRYIVGLPVGGALAGTVGSALSNQENREVGQHTHGITQTPHTHTYTPPIQTGTGSGASSAKVDSPTQTGGSNANITINSAGAVAGTNAPYIQLIVCQKN